MSRNAVAAPPHARRNQRVSTDAFWGDIASDLSDPEFRRAYASATTSIAAVDTAISAEALALGQEVSRDDRRSS